MRGMLKYVGYDIVFQEIPDETTLAINLSLCPNRCKGCHSPYLQKDRGDELTAEALDRMVSGFAGEVTCVCFMGGDNAPQEVAALARHIRQSHSGQFLTAWYSGKPDFPKDFDRAAFDFVKLGPYIPEKGPLNKPTTNQRLYRIMPGGTNLDITDRFWRK